MKSNILDKLNGSKTVLIVGHVRPDGDCVGGCLALREYLKNMGIKDVDVAVPSQITDYLMFVPGTEDFNDLHHGKYDTFVALDCGGLDRFGRLDVFFRTAKKTICIDHHDGHDGFADYNLVNPDAAAVCEILFGLMDEKGAVDSRIANYLFVGLSSDTGHFMHSNTNARVLEIASKLATYGADVFNIARNLNKVRSKAKTALIAMSLAGIRYYNNDTIAIITITKEMLDSLGLSMGDSDGIVDYANEVKGVKIGCSMCEENPGVFKLSLRSNTTDVAKLAGMFGGGGHKASSGCKITGDPETVTKKLLEAISQC